MIKQLDRLLFMQGNRCFFCGDSIPDGEASVEHLVASSKGGARDDENCVACCKTINAVFGSLSVKAKLQIVLSHRGQFKCPQSLPQHEPAAKPVSESTTGAARSATTNKPATTTNMSATTANKPVAITNKPATTANKPATTANKPAATTNKPTTTTNKPATTTETRATKAIANLQKRANNRPLTLAALKNSLNSLFGKALSEQDMDSLLKRLQTARVLEITDTKISYPAAANTRLNT